MKRLPVILGLVILLTGSPALAQEQTLTLPSYTPGGNGYVISNPSFEVKVNPWMTPDRDATESEVAAWAEITGGTVEGYKYNGKIYRTPADVGNNTIVQSQLTPSARSLLEVKASGSVRNDQGSTIGSFSDAVTSGTKAVWRGMVPIEKLDDVSDGYSVKLDRVTSTVSPAFEDKLAWALDAVADEKARESERQSQQGSAAEGGGATSESYSDTQGASSTSSAADRTYSQAESSGAGGSAGNQEQQPTATQLHNQRIAEQKAADAARNRQLAQQELERSRQLEAEGWRQAEEGLMAAAEAAQGLLSMRAQRKANRERAQQMARESDARLARSRSRREAWTAQAEIERYDVISDLESGLHASRYGGLLSDVAQDTTIPSGTEIFYTKLEVEEQLLSGRPRNNYPVTEISHTRDFQPFALTDKTRTYAVHVEVGLTRECQEERYYHGLSENNPNYEFEPSLCFIVAAPTEADLTALLEEVITAEQYETVQTNGNIWTHNMFDVVSTATEEDVINLALDMFYAEKHKAQIGTILSEIMLERNLAVRGGRFAMGHWSPPSVEGHVVVHERGATTEIMLHWAEPGVIRMEKLTGPTQGGNLIFDGLDAWRADPDEAGQITKTALNGVAAEVLRMWSGGDMMTTRRAQAGYPLSYDGEVGFRSSDHTTCRGSADEVELYSLPEMGGEDMVVHFDAKTNLECSRKIVVPAESGGGGTSVEWRSSSYADLAGVLMPQKIDIHIGSSDLGAERKLVASYIMEIPGSEAAAIRSGEYEESQTVDFTMAEPLGVGSRVGPVLVNEELMKAAKKDLLLNYAGLAGKVVVVKLLIDKDGVVEDARVTQASGDDIVDGAALGLTNVMRFSPATEDGRLVKARVEVAVEFPGNNGAAIRTQQQDEKAVDDFAAGKPKSASPQVPAVLANGEVIETVKEEVRRYYPDLAGKAVVRLSIDQEGVVGDVEIVQSSGDSTVDEGALGLATMMRFSPATEDGRAVKTTIEMPIEFAMD